MSGEENKIFGNRTPLVSYNRGLKKYFLGFNNKKIGENKQHECYIMSSEQQKRPICTRLGAYIYHIQIFHSCIASYMTME